MKNMPLLIDALSLSDQENHRNGLRFRKLDGALLGVAILISIFALLEVGHMHWSIILAFLVPISFSVLLLRAVFGAKALTRCYRTTFKGGVLLRHRILTHLTRLPLSSFSTLHSGKIAQTLSEDTMWMENHAGFFRPAALADRAALAVLMIGVFALNWQAAIAVITVAGAGLIVLRRLRAGLTRGLAFRSTGLTQASRHFIEYADGIQVIRAFGSSQTAQAAIQENNEQMRCGFKKAILRFTPLTSVVHGFAFTAVSAGIFAALLTADHSFDVIGVVFLLTATLIPVRSIISGGTIASLAKIGERNVQEIEEKQELGAGTANAGTGPATVVFDDVSYSYRDGHPAISGVSLTAKPRTITAIVGPSGAGKTTLMNLLLRFSDLGQGVIRLDGQDIRHFSTTSYMDRFAVVFQDTALFRDTIRSNIQIGRPDANENDIIAAAKAAQIHDMIIALPDGYDTVVGPSGQTLSGGERQRVTIARAILKDADIVILDEATSALDPENEREIQLAFETLIQGKTVFIIAHRLSTIVGVDNICVLDKGRITAQGTHDDLLKASELYGTLWRTYTATQDWQI